MNMLSSSDVAAQDLQYWLQQQESSLKIRLQITDDVIACILKECEDHGKSAEAVLNARFKATRVIEGFKEICEATGRGVDFFSINMAMYENPEEEISKWKDGLKTVK